MGRWLVVHPIAGLPDSASYMAVVADCMTERAADLVAEAMNDRPWIERELTSNMEPAR
jgi:hypothetical protein